MCGECACLVVRFGYVARADLRRFIQRVIGRLKGGSPKGINEATLTVSGRPPIPVEVFMKHRNLFIRDQRGAVALEMPAVVLFLMMFLLVPLADLTTAGFKFISAHQALRDMGQRTQYSNPDATDAASIANWKSSIPTTVDGYPISAKIYCGDPGTEAPCAGTTWPKYYTFETSFTLSPMVLGSVLCSTCTVNYSQRFQ
jgi:hypothetical protein